MVGLADSVADRRTGQRQLCRTTEITDQQVRARRPYRVSRYGARN